MDPDQEKTTWGDFVNDFDFPKDSGPRENLSTGDDKNRHLPTTSSPRSRSTFTIGRSMGLEGPDIDDSGQTCCDICPSLMLFDLLGGSVKRQKTSHSTKLGTSSKPSTSGLGRMVQTEIRLRKNESLGLTGSGRKLGSRVKPT